MAALELERRQYEFDVRAATADDGSKIITGRPIVYNSRTDIGKIYEEVILPGALSGTDLRDVRFLVNHDRQMIPLARSRRNNGNSTMQFSVDDQGLRLDWVKLDVENNTTSRALYSAVDRGDISGMSFTFSVRGQKWSRLDTDYPLREITDIASIVEVSAVTFPAYDATEIYARSEGALESARQLVETARQTRAKPLESELELLKQKTRTMILGGF
ncbi:MAG: HK97 family phage prohead protease [Lachnospiraceae bacterium]|nr:HK97 family phage prohead protease [Lachnospiraceae bacterium]